MAAMGRYETKGAKTKMAPRENKEWKTLERGDLAPNRIFVAVLAMAPVAAIPPKKGQIKFPIPRARATTGAGILLLTLGQIMRRKRVKSPTVISTAEKVPLACHRA